MSYKISTPIHADVDAIYYRGLVGEEGTPAIVKIPREQHPDARTLARLRHEHSMLRELRIPGIPVPFSLTRHGSDSLALLLEDFPGEPLSQLVKRQRLNWQHALRIAASVAGILATLHSQRIIHQSIRPDNIFIDEAHEQVHLIDFRLASRLGTSAAMPLTVALQDGAIEYVSPEQTGRINRIVDSRTDLYSLGITLYWMLTGATPFSSDDPLEVVHSHIARKPPAPSEAAPAVPTLVSELVLKLLAKSPEERYQTARGLKADLDNILGQLATSETLTPFEFGRGDCDGVLRPAQKLYGRETELKVLLEAFERVRKGSCELLLVSGYSGIGKSALVQEVLKPIVVQGGQFIAGKFDQFNRNVPYDSLVQAFRELIRQLLGGKQENLATWKARIQEAVSPNGALLTALIPELELIIGPQPAVQPLGPAESQNRFKLVLQAFVLSLATADHPLVLFLDDLQWIDSASLKMLEAILTDPERGYVLMIGAYRDNEVDSAHILSLALNVLRKQEVKLSEITLAPLNLASVTAMLADMLNHPAAHVAPLAQIVHSKTHGNPFFVSQFVTGLHSEKLLLFAEASGHWEWDLAAIRTRMVTDNVVTFLIEKLRGLPPETQNVLQLAAAIGHRVELKTLCTIVEQGAADVSSALWPALQAGLLWPLNVDYQFLLPGESNVPEALSRAEFQVTFKFVHDRVQQASYALIPEKLRQSVHLRIGRLLLRGRGESAGERQDSLFDIAKHLNLGMALITDDAERLELIRLNLTVARRAKSSSSPEATAAYLTAGLSLFKEGEWEKEYELWFSLASELAECESVNGRFAVVTRLLDQLTERCRSDVEYAQTTCLRMSAYIMQGKHTESLTCGAQALARLGIELSSEPEAIAAAFGAELVAAAANLGDRRIPDLLHAQVATDVPTVVTTKLLNQMANTAYLVAPHLYGLIILKQVNVSLRHGHTEWTAYSYVSYGFILAGMMEQYEKGYEFGRLALALNEKFNNVALTCQIHSILGIYLHFCAPLREAIDSFSRSYRAGLESGDLLYLSFACFSIIVLKLNLGHSLDEVAAENSWFMTIASRTKDATAAPQLLLYKQIIENLQGRTRSRASLSSDSFDEDKFRAGLEASGVAPNICRYYLAKLQLDYLYGSYDTAYDFMQKNAGPIAALTGLYERGAYVFYSALVLFAVARSATIEEREAHKKALAGHEKLLATWAAQCPANYGVKLAIFRALQASLEGRPDAGGLFEAAVAMANDSDFTREAALANELAGQYFLERGKSAAAKDYILTARRLYLRWGALAKVAHLDQIYPSLLRREAPQRQPSEVEDSEPLAPVVTAPEKSDATLDLITVLRVAQTLASQIVLKNVLEELLHAVVANSGAQRGCLVLERDGELFLEALIDATGVVRAGLSVPIESSTEVARSVIQYVARTRETVVLGDASGRNRFASDRYIISQQPKSLLCLALIHQSRLVGILYLENNLANDVFTEKRVELLRLLSSHAAVSVQNALLYSQVTAITEQLRSANQELAETNARLQVELQERARAEQERIEADQQRAALQEEVIRVQSVRLAELSTPMIPIHDQIMVMPIIGTVDEQRAEQVVEAALNGAQAHRTQTVIIDITGMKHIDTNVARTLMQAATALRLLGTHAVLTGIRAEVAQTLVRLGVDLSSLVTLGTLQSGIAYALKRTGQSVVQTKSEPSFIITKSEKSGRY